MDKALAWLVILCLRLDSQDVRKGKVKESLAKVLNLYWSMLYFSSPMPLDSLLNFSRPPVPYL